MEDFHKNYFLNSDRPLLLHQKCDFSKRMASYQGYKSIHLCLDLHCPVAFTKELVSYQCGLSKEVTLKYSLAAKLVVCKMIDIDCWLSIYM